MIYFISDLHLGHTGILRLCNRPFASVEEMDEALIGNWNKKVGQRDTVYLVGDLIWDKKRAAEYLPRLNGKKILIYGNHDEHMINNPEFQSFFEEICPMKFVSLNGHPITLCHYPLLEWKNSRKKGTSRLGYLIYGHIHNNVLPEYHPLFSAFNALNAGADINRFQPVSFEELVKNNEAFSKNALEQLAKRNGSV